MVGWVLATVALVVLLMVVLGPVTWLLAGGPVRHLRGRDQADALNAVRQTLLTALGGAAALVALGFTVRTFYLSRRGQVTDRYGKAITMLASERLEERLGGLYALEQVMADAPGEHTAVVSVLCAFVRARASGGTGTTQRPAAGTEPAADIDAALIVLARRPERPEPKRPDLRKVCLMGLGLRSYDFATRPRLTRMFLTGADLRSADLRGSDLRGTIATDADLRGALLANVDARRTGLGRADLRGALLTGADLTQAQLRGTDLRQTEGLTAEQLSGARIDAQTQLPDHLRRDPWVAARISDCEHDPDDNPWACPPPTPRPSN